MKTEDWKAIETAKALVIGHDPRLQKSDTIAAFALFADYFFRVKPTSPSEMRKYGLAKATFDQITDITNGNIIPKIMYVTNLCNYPLPRTPDKTVLITIDKAKAGLENIKNILLNNPTIDYIFPMSMQVNYWLQKLGFYSSNNDFLVLSEPREVGLLSNPPYYKPIQQKTFTLICGNIYTVTDGYQKVIPILHVKNYPLKGNFLEAYGLLYDHIRKYFKDHCFPDKV